MNDSQLIAILASIVLQASPLIIAVCGEILTERSGVVNLSLDGTMLMAAMTGFVVPAGVTLYGRITPGPKPGGDRLRSGAAR